jgi:hypothetical protein
VDHDGVALSDVEPADLPATERTTGRGQEDGETERGGGEARPGPTASGPEGDRQERDCGGRPASLARDPHRRFGTARHDDRFETGQGRRRRPGQRTRERLDSGAIGEERHPEDGESQT